MISINDLPTLNASLNMTSAFLLVLGYSFIRRKEMGRHKVCMVSAFITSTLFLVFYLIYHYHIGSKPFLGQGWFRYLYFTILISHTLLAATIVPLVIITLNRALRGRFDLHRRIARWTLPLWLYVAISGIAVYLMLYRFDGR